MFLHFPTPNPVDMYRDDMHLLCYLSTIQDSSLSSSSRYQSVQSGISVFSYSFLFQVYFPAVKVKNKLKNGTYKVKPKPLFPGCTFLYCILNKEIHDFVRECDGIGGFIGAKVGNSYEFGIQIPSLSCH